MSRTHLPHVPVRVGGPPVIRCSQCWRRKAAEEFVGRRGRVVKMCADCRLRFRDYAPRGRSEHLLKPGELRVSLKIESANRKTGPIPVSISSPGTCPPSCGFFGKGCYAEFHLLRFHWARVPERGLTWVEFCRAIAALPPGQVWRHNQAGDLPGDGERLDVQKLASLVRANRDRRGFTFTHKRLALPAERAAVRAANAHGFAALGVGPVCVVISEDAPDRASKTPGGLQVVVCPAQTSDLTCETCKLCAKPQRKSIVAFRAHGQMSKRVSELVQLGRTAR